jgi:hypothetical protein
MLNKLGNLLINTLEHEDGKKKQPNNMKTF